MQRRLIGSRPLLNEKGELTQAGYATDLCLTYDRRKIRAGALRIKEWDYYLINDGEKAFALTVADNSYMGLASVSLLDLKAPWQMTAGSMRLLPLGRTGLPPTSRRGNVAFRGRRAELSFHTGGGIRRLSCEMGSFGPDGALHAELTLTGEPPETMVIATPFGESKKAFYYNQKINCLRAEGIVSYAGRDYVFSPDRAFAVLDWGRGVWPYQNTWYWGTASGQLEGVPFGFNIGYGFGDTSAASENMLFYDGRASKLEQVAFHIPRTADGRGDYLKPWTFTSGDGRFEMDFRPVIDRSAHDSMLFLSSDQHQVFGFFSGRAVLDNGRELAVRDLPGAAEKVVNRW